MKNGIELELEKKLIDEIAEEKKFISFRKLVKIFELNAEPLLSTKTSSSDDLIYPYG